MGRLSFEGYTAHDMEVVQAKQKDFEASKQSFDANLGDLKKAVDKNPNLSEAVTQVELIYANYLSSASSVFYSHQRSLDLLSVVGQLQEIIE